MFIPTSWVTLLKEKTEENEFGDEVDDYKAVRSHIGVHISERAPAQNYLPGDARLQTINSYLVLAPVSVELEKGDRLKDDNTGDVYIIDKVYSSRSFVGGLSQRAVLRMIE